mgnify:CR=1 FL=1
MRVKSVIHENVTKDKMAQRYAVQFEHAGVVWEKFLPIFRLDEVTLKNWIQSVIDDTLARNTRWDQN